jgi:hypothetical protein
VQMNRRGGVGTYLDPYVLLRIIISGRIGAAVDLLTLARRGNIVSRTERGSLAVLHVDQR